jgi:hypothetical protein
MPKLNSCQKCGAKLKLAPTGGENGARGCGRRVDTSKGHLFGRLEATGISLATFPSTVHLAPGNLTRVDERFDAVVWESPSIAVHAVPQRGALESVLSAVLVISLRAKVLFGLGNFSGLGIG